jgi:capsular exopolysaccharide synthesis family protein
MVTSNLGIALAETGCSVLLIDGDSRKPSLHSAFDASEEPGLCSLLKNSGHPPGASLQSIAQPTRYDRLKVISSGRAGDPLSSLLYSRGLSQLLGSARQDFQMITIDTPPILLLPDARIFGRVADAVVLVLRASETNRESALLAKRQLQEDGTPLLGIILNDWLPSASRGYHYYQYRQ